MKDILNYIDQFKLRLISILLTGMLPLTASHAQIPIHDRLGSPHYELMPLELIDLGVVTGKTTLGMFGVAETLGWELNSITQMHIEIVTLGEHVIDFIDYECTDFIETEYPLIDPELFFYESLGHLGNKKKRDLFFQKFEFEKQNVRNYMDSENPISEGERILLMLSVVEDIMITCLEQEDEF